MFIYHTQVAQSHIDLYGHMNNASYLQILENARWVMLKEQGISADKINQLGIGPVILEITIKFLKELKLHDDIEIQTEILSFQNKIGKLAQNIMKGDELCCKAEFTMALFDLKNRKIIEPSQQQLALFGLHVNN
jgi:YbgC/YbaW family acyl-CoA thioester hydrolase